MNTYFCLLDFASLFSLLVRLHYEDLINICKTRTYLWKITCTPFFQEKWKEYNITTNIHKYDTPTLLGVSEIHSEVDRNGKLHGTQLMYNYDNEISDSIDFVQGVRHGLHIKWNRFKSMLNDQPKIIVPREEYPYVDGKIHGTAMTHYGDGSIKYTPYKNGYLDGLIRGYNGSIDRITWNEYRDNIPFGKHIEWKPDGSFLHIKSTRNYETHGKQFEWYPLTNTKYREYTCIDGEFHGLYLQWNDQGVLIKHQEYEYGVKIK